MIKIVKISSKPKNIFLVGPMGVGKTTIGKLLASTLKMTFKDSDREIEEHTGASISLIFELEGESGFRKREKAMIQTLTQQTGLILSTGGGVVLNEDNRNNLKKYGYVVYLYASIRHLLERTMHGHTRPLLEKGDPKTCLEKMMTERHHLYKSVANITVDTGNRTARQVLRYIVKILRQNFPDFKN